MDKEHTQQTLRIEADIRKLDERLDRHLEIYAQNGKELAALKQEVSDIKTTVNGKCDSIMNAVHEIKVHYVSEKEFHPVRLLTYGAAGLLLTGVLIALIATVV